MIDIPKIKLSNLSRSGSKFRRNIRVRSRSNERKSFRNRSRDKDKSRDRYRNRSRDRNYKSNSRDQSPKRRVEEREPTKPIDSYTLYDIIIKGKKGNPSGQYERTTEQRLRRRLSRG